MKTSLLKLPALLLLALLVLTACMTSRTERYYQQHPAESVMMTPAPLAPVAAALKLPPSQEPYMALPPYAQPRPSLFRRVFPAKRRLAANQAGYAPWPATGQAPQVPKKCKGCQFYYGPATVTTVGKKATAAVGDEATATTTTTGKKSGPVIANSDSASLTNQAGATNATAIKGDGNTVTPTNTVAEAPGVGATIAGKITGPLGAVAALGAVALLGYGVYYFWFLIPRRRREA